MKILNNIRYKVINKAPEATTAEKDCSYQPLTEAINANYATEMADTFGKYANANGGELFLQKGNRIIKDIQTSFEEEEVEDDITAMLDDAYHNNLEILAGMREKAKVHQRYDELMDKYTEDPASVSPEDLADAKAALLGVYPSEFFAVMLEGIPGVAKTASVKAWCKKNHVKLFYQSLYGLDETSIAGMPIANVEDKTIDLFTSEFIQNLYNCNEPCLIFFDEYNRGSMAVRNAALGLVLNHTALIRDSRNLGKENEDSKIAKITQDGTLKGEDLADAAKKFAAKGNNLSTGERPEEEGGGTKAAILTVPEQAVNSDYTIEDLQERKPTLSTEGLLIPNLVLVVGAKNPDNSPEIKQFKLGMKDAESARFTYNAVVEANKKKAHAYLNKALATVFFQDTDEINTLAASYKSSYSKTSEEQRKQAIRELLLGYALYSSPEFSFITYKDYEELLNDSATGKVSSKVPANRSIEQLIRMSRGYKDKFLQYARSQKWNETEMAKVEAALASYQDPDFTVSQGEVVVENPITGQPIDSIKDLADYCREMGIDSASKDIADASTNVQKEVSSQADPEAGKGVIAAIDIDDVDFDFDEPNDSDSDYDDFDFSL